MEEEIKQKMLKINRKNLDRILRDIGIIIRSEAFDNKELILRWYTSNAWIVKIRRKKIYLAIYQSVSSLGTNEIIKIEAWKGEMPDLNEINGKTELLNIPKFLVNDFIDNMNSNKIRKRVESLLKLVS